MAAGGVGRIAIPPGTDVWPHELATARALAAEGKDVEFLRRTSGDGVRSADIVMDGVVWEIKAPRTSNLKKIQRVLRRAGSQSRSVIIDSARLEHLSDRSIERELRRLKPLVKSVRRLILVTKSRSVIEI